MSSIAASSLLKFRIFFSVKLVCRPAALFSASFEVLVQASCKLPLRPQKRFHAILLEDHREVPELLGQHKVVCILLDRSSLLLRGRPAMENIARTYDPQLFTTPAEKPNFHSTTMPYHRT